MKESVAILRLMILAVLCWGGFGVTLASADVTYSGTKEIHLSIGLIRPSAVEGLRFMT
jgi:hypothetical protein